MNKQRQSYAPDEKVAIIRQHLLDGVATSEPCDAQGLHPTRYSRWQKEFFEGGAAAFAKEADRRSGTPGCRGGMSGNCPSVRGQGDHPTVSSSPGGGGRFRPQSAGIYSLKTTGQKRPSWGRGIAT